MANCASTHTCHVCKARHNSLLYKEEEDKKTTGTVMITKAKEDKENKQQKVKSGFINTAVLSVQHGSRRLIVRAALDNCSSCCVTCSEQLAPTTN